MTPQIIATIGPASADKEILRGMIREGVSLARFNFSWGTHAEHRQFIRDIRNIAGEEGVDIPILQDLSGPRVKSKGGHTFAAGTKAFTDKDRIDLAVALECEIEYVAMSFVSSSQDIEELKSYLDSENIKAKIVAKIERQEALEDLDRIIAVSDGVMVARGDLGAAVPVEELPFVKKDILKKAIEANKPSIVATGLLTSMMDDKEPSRADVSDITSAVLDGASALMLSNETAVGHYPVEAVETMRKIIIKASAHTELKSRSQF